MLPDTVLHFVTLKNRYQAMESNDILKDSQKHSRITVISMNFMSQLTRTYQKRGRTYDLQGHQGPLYTSNLA